MIYLIKNNNAIQAFKDVIYWSEKCIEYKSGLGICKIYASDNEYFTDQEPQNVEEES
jgi:hypothetical protein